MVNISGHTPQAPFYIPKDARSLITGHCKEAILQHRGKVDYYELFNEPEIWGGRTTNPDPAKYNPSTPESCAAATVQMAQAIRELDPQGKNRRSRMPRETGISGGVSEGGRGQRCSTLLPNTPTRQLPELPDLETAQQEFQATLKRYRPDLPILSSESGNMNFPTLPDNRIHPLAVQYAARDLRYALIEFACGVKSYFPLPVDRNRPRLRLDRRPRRPRSSLGFRPPSSMRSGTAADLLGGGSGRRPGPARGQQALLHFRQRLGTNRRALAVGGDARNARIRPRSRLLRHDGQLIFREKDPAG